MNDLILSLVVLQVAAPASLILLNVILISSSWIGMALRVVGIALLLTYLILSGVWLFPPWWTLHLLIALHVIGSWIAYLRFKRLKIHTGHRRFVSEIFIAGLVVVAGLYLLLQAIAGRTLPENTVDLQIPLTSGHYLVTSGGTTAAVNNHLMTLTGERFRAYRGQSYALDLIKVDNLGLRARGISPSDPRSYYIYGTEITAPCTGTVAAAVDGIDDMAVPEMDRNHMLGNYVILACKSFFVIMAHMAPGSVTVLSGEMVDSGQTIGKVGNTGNTAEPHLHIHV